MAINTTLFFDQQRTYGVGALTFDLILAESHNFNSSVSEYNIENGSIISDHIQKELENGTLSGLISNFSLTSPGIVSNRAQDAFDLLEQIYNDQQLVTVYTVNKVYENVAIVSIGISRDDSTGEATIAEISFRKVNVVSLKEIVIQASVFISDMDTDLNKQSSPNIDMGKGTGVSR